MILCHWLLRTATADRLSVQIVICSFTGLFLKQLITQSCIASTFVWKGIASCPSEMCHCILLLYLQIPAPVPCRLQAPSVNDTCPFLSQLGQSLSHSSLVGITVRCLPNVCLSLVFYHAELVAHFIFPLFIYHQLKISHKVLSLVLFSTRFSLLTVLEYFKLLTTLHNL